MKNVENITKTIIQDVVIEDLLHLLKNSGLQALNKQSYSDLILKDERVISLVKQITKKDEDIKEVIKAYKAEAFVILSI